LPLELRELGPSYRAAHPEGVDRWLALSQFKSDEPPGPGGDVATRVAPGGDAAPRVAPGEDAAPRVAPGGDAAPRVAPGEDAAPRVAPGEDAAPRVAPGGPGGDAATRVAPAGPGGDAAYALNGNVDVTLASLATLSTPVLLLTGDADMYMPPSTLRWFAKHVPRAEVAIVPESGHASYWEQPQVFNRTVLAFLTRAPD
jgi:pimeloyl-ACP methyl ester carboxylesterase